MTDPKCPECDPEKGFDGPGLGYRVYISKEEAFKHWPDETPKKSRIERLKELGLLGCLNESGITSENCKQYLRGEFPFGPIPHWIKCSERLPEIGQAVLIFQQYPKGTMFTADARPLKRIFMYVAEFSYNKTFVDEFSSAYKHVIAWQPLPEPPHE